MYDKGGQERPEPQLSRSPSSPPSPVAPKVLFRDPILPKRYEEHGFKTPELEALKILLGFDIL